MFRFGVSWRAGWACLLAVCFAVAGQPRATAAESLKPAETSLGFLPDSVAFYSASLRMDEQLQIVLASNTWKKLTQLPAVQMGLGLYQLQAALPDSPLAPLHQFLNDPKWENTRALVRDMFAQEVFCSGDKDMVDALRLLMELQRTTQFGPALARLSNPGLSVSDEKIQAKLLMATLLEKANAIRTPGMLLGFRLKQPQRALDELNRLEKAVLPLLDLVPQAKGRLQRVKVGAADCLTLSLDGQMIPWEMLPLDQAAEFENNPGDIKKLIARAKNLKLVIAIGVRSNYLLVSIGPSTAALAKLGTGKLLVDRPELAPLKKFADRRLVGVAYVSSTLMTAANNPQDSVNSILQLVQQALPAAKLPAAQQQRITRDAAQLAEELMEFVPEPKAVSQFSFLAANGYEGYQYQWGPSMELDGSKPLTLLEHVGGAPLAAFVLRGKSSPKGYELLVKWAPIALRYAEEIGLAREENSEQKEKIKQLVALLRKTGARLDQINRTALLPALADGQAGFVLDGKLQSKQFFQQMPAADAPLPMFEPALVIGVSDRQKLRTAMSDYLSTADDFWAELRKITKEELPEFKIPRPKSVSSKQGEVFFYPLPKEWGIDKQLLPNAALGEHVAVLSISRNHSQRLLASTPWKGGALPASPQQPLAAAGCVRCADSVDLLLPWIDYGVKVAMEQNPQMAENKAQVKYVLDQVRTALGLLKAFKGASSEVYLENRATVEHWRAEFEDVK